MKPLCEVIVKEVLPAVRSILAEELKKSGMKQGEIAEKLGLTQPAVSQYLKASRGKQAQLLSSNAKISKILKQVAEQFKQGKNAKGAGAFCEICKDIRSTGLICSFHRDIMTGLGKCTACMKGDVCGC